MNKSFLGRCALGVSVAFLAGSAFAGPVPGGTYSVHDHPDGAVRNPTYIMRLDGLEDLVAGSDIFTFSTSSSYGPSVGVLLDYDDGAGTIHIHGTVYGGLDVGSAYSGVAGQAGLWTIDFTYAGVAPYAADSTGLQDITAIPTANADNTGTNTGTLTRLFNSSAYDASYDLVDFFGHYPYTFRFGDDGADSGGEYAPPGHRGYDGLSGWGWMNHSGAGLDTHVASSDWLFTATPVPAPGAALLGMLGFSAIGYVRRRLS